MFALHIGVEPTRPGASVTVANHSDAEEEKVIILGERWGFVSGSWACWGVADQDTGGNNSLHVVVPCVDEAEVPALRSDLKRLIGRDCRLRDYSILSDFADWSENHVVVPDVNRFEGPIGDEPESFVCAECGTTTATTYVVTTEPGRTEVCRACDNFLRSVESQKG